MRRGPPHRDALRDDRTVFEEITGGEDEIELGSGKTCWFEGNFRAYEESLAADNPDRIAHRRSKYKRLTLR